MATDIGPADALRAARQLGPIDRATGDRILALLGVNAAPRHPVVPSVGVWQSSLPTAPVTTAPVVVPAAPPAAARPPAPGATPQEVPRRLESRSRTTPQRTTVRQIQPEPEASESPAWLLEADPLPRPSADPEPDDAGPPLFGTRTRRAALGAALATLVHEGDIDVGAVVAMLTEGRPLRRVPRLPALTLRRGVQVLVDVGAGIDPYRGDVAHVLQAFDDLLPDDRCSVAYFRGTPARDVFTTDRQSSRRWSPPPLATPVLLITDLGIGGPALSDDRASVAEWLAFAALVRTAGYRLLALVPYEARRWPPRLTRVMTILHWSERTTVGEVRRALREAYR